MMPEQDGQRRLGVSGGSTHFAHRAERGSGRAHSAASAVGEESEVADANQAAGQDVKQETAQGTHQQRSVMTFFLPPCGG